MGISVKSRCRHKGTESEPLSIRPGDFKKMLVACKDFSCEPYFAIVIDGADIIRCFILPMKKILKINRLNKSGLDWKMKKSDLIQYYNDPEIKIFEFSSKTHSWWK
ncbi:MAG: hypothetical protein AAB345_04670 [Patescibacteria group bacterium]